MQTIIEPPPNELMVAVGGGFEAVGREFMRYFTTLGRLEPGDRVLDIGCGCGRMAIPLTRFLVAAGSYEGFDIAAAAIDYCKREITPCHPNFRFKVADIHNGVYNPAGQGSAANFTFPYKKSEFDFAFATSVFTHLLPEALDNYLSEVARVLKPGGRFLSTWFLWNAETAALTETKQAELAFEHQQGPLRTLAPGNPETAVCYDEAHVLELFAKVGLTLEPIRYGSWCGRARHLSYQDIVVASRPEQHGPARKGPWFLKRFLRTLVRSAPAPDKSSASSLPPGGSPETAAAGTAAPGISDAPVKAAAVPSLPDFASASAKSLSQRFADIPHGLVAAVNSAVNEELFMEVGAKVGQCIIDLFACPSDSPDVLDFGCGLGRVLLSLRKHWPAARFAGFDTDPRMLEWARYLLNDQDLPLVNSTTLLPDAAFDFIYAISVFTHLDATTDYWLAEIHRLLKPTGKALITFHDETLHEEYAQKGLLSGPKASQQLESVQVYGRDTGPAGATSIATFYTTEAWEDKLAPWFDVEHTAPRGLIGHQSFTVASRRDVQTEWHELQRQYIVQLERDLARLR